MSSTSELQFIETDAGQIYDFIMYVLENGVTAEAERVDNRVVGRKPGSKEFLEKRLQLSL